MTTPGMQGEVSPESMKKAASSAVGSAPHAKPVSPRSTGNYAEQNWIKPCRGKPFYLLIYGNSWNWKVKKEIPALKLVARISRSRQPTLHRRKFSPGVRTLD
jgi:hypothetical protein